MFAYTICILMLIKNFKTSYTDVTHPWYADKAGALGAFARVEAYFNLLERHGPGRGYHPKPSKSGMIVHPNNIEDGKMFDLRHGFKVFMGSRYLGGYIGDDEFKHE